IRQADETARAAGVNGRIDFRKESIHDLSGGSFDVVLCIETLHEMAKPNPALIRIRERASGGTLIVIEQDSVNPQLLAATNFLYCLPVSIAAGGGASRASGGRWFLGDRPHSHIVAVCRAPGNGMTAPVFDIPCLLSFVAFLVLAIRIPLSNAL